MYILYSKLDVSSNMNSKITAIALVAIIIVAGAAIIITHNNGNSNDSTVPGQLLIYGNADGDNNLDQDDVKYIEDIISGKKTKTTFADANQDGTINQKDIDLVNTLISGKSTTAYYYNALEKKSESFKYPINTIYTVSIDSALATKILGLDDRVIAVSSLTQDTVLFEDVYSRNVPNLGTNPTIESISTIASKLDAIICNTYANNLTNETALEATGNVKVIRLAFEAADNLSAYLTYGFMTNTTERAESFVKFSADVLNTISEKTSKLSDSEIMKGMVLGYNIIYGKQQNYGVIITNAGGIDAVDWDAYRKCSDGYEWLYNYKFDYIVGLANPAGYDYKVVEGAQSECISIWEKHYDRYEKTTAVQNGHLIVVDNNLPIIIKTAYVAQYLYPDLFDSNFGNEIHQKYIDLFIDNLHGSGFDVEKDGVFVLTTEFIKSLQ